MQTGRPRLQAFDLRNRRYIDYISSQAPRSFLMSNAQKIINEAFQLHQSGKIEDAIKLYSKVLAKQQGNAQLLYFLGTANLQIGQLRLCVEQLRKSLKILPNNPFAFNNLGSALRGLKQPDQAILNYDKALSLKPDYAEAHYNRGNALRDLHRPEEALVSFRNALTIRPDYAEAYNNQGLTLQHLNRPEEALASFHKALAIRRDFAEAYNNQGLAFQQLNRSEEALSSYDKALALKPDYAEAYWNKSLLLILMGQYLEGWELFEWRFKNEQLKHDAPPFPKPPWRGQADIRGRKLLIHGEQGYGDVIQFCRYLPQVRALGADIILEVQQPLVPLVSTLNCPMTVVAKGDVLPEVDAYCPIMSLPYVFKTTVGTIPAEVPYLFSDKEKVKVWQEKLGPARLRVGLTWSGSRDHKNDLNRSIWLKELLPLTDLPIEWHSLQKEYRQPDLEILEAHPEIRQHQDDLTDFSDAAALIECLDLVISVDTSTAHLAGALGKPVWILLPHAPDYRWMLDREDSPWYPSARLFRQSKAGDWAGVIQSVKEQVCQKF